jgi:molybdopterin-guanine dinucleotide biosynthesis protein A
MTPAVAGIFVGGAGARMGGIAKGLMRTESGATIIARWVAVLAPLGLEVVLVGAHPDYADLGMEVVPDEPRGIGPLGGLLALLRRAYGTRALALACDMPFVSSTLVEHLLTTSPEAAILAPRRNGRWEPLCARYEPSRVLATAVECAQTRDHSLQRLLGCAGARELCLAPGEVAELHDWDAPLDIESGTSG